MKYKKSGVPGILFLYQLIAGKMKGMNRNLVKKRSFKQPFIFIIIFIFSSKSILAQSTSKVDSLKYELSFLQDDSIKVNKYNSLGQLFYKINDYSESKKTAQQSLVLSKKLNYQRGMATAFDILGQAEEKLGNYPESEQSYMAAIEIKKGLDNKLLLASTYNNLGNLYNLQGEYSEALKYHYKALNIKMELNDSTTLPASYNNIGLISTDLNYFDDAIENYKKSISICNLTGNKRSKAVALNNLGSVYRNIGKYDIALECFKKAVQINLEIGNEDFLARNYDNMGMTYLTIADSLLNENKDAEANQYFKDAKSILISAIGLQEKKGAKTSLAKASTTMGRVCTKLKEYADAETYLTNSIATLIEVGVPKYLKDAYMYLAELYFKMASERGISDSIRVVHMEKGLANLKLQHLLKDSLSNAIKAKEIDQLKVKYETGKKNDEIVLLSRERSLQQLQMKEQLSALLVAKLREERNEKELELLSKSNAIGELQLAGSRHDLEAEMLKAKAKSDELELAKKTQELKDRNHAEEKKMRDVTIAGSFALLLVGALMFNRFKLRKQLEHQQTLINQRKNISADLHDDVGSTLSSISIYSEAIKNKLIHNEPERVMELVHKIGDNARETITNLSDIVWSINPANDRGEVVFSRMESFASFLLSSKNIQLNFTCDDTLREMDFNMETRQHLFLIFKEAINNAAKYSNANQVNVSVNLMNGKIKMSIADNGVGFSVPGMSENGKSNGSIHNGGNGLNNIRLRTDQLKGKLDIRSSKEGTTLELVLPLT